MPTIEALALVTNQGSARLAEVLASGKSFRVDHFVLGSNGHTVADPSLAISPDPTRTGCYCGPLGADIESISTAGGCSFYGPVDEVTFASPTCPVFRCVADPGDATGAVSSLCLLGTIVYSPVPGDPEVGTQFLFAITFFPLKFRTPLYTLEHEVHSVLYRYY